MNIVTISGKAGSGKTTALKLLACKQAITTGGRVEAMISALQSRVVAFATETFIDEVSQQTLQKLREIAKSYPAHYRMFVCLQA